MASLSTHKLAEVCKRASDRCAMKVDSVPQFLKTAEKPTFREQLWIATLLWETLSMAKPHRITIVLVISPGLQTANPKTYWVKARATRKVCSHWTTKSRMQPHQQLSRANQKHLIRFQRDHHRYTLVSSQNNPPIMRTLKNYQLLLLPRRINLRKLNNNEFYKSYPIWLLDLKRD